MDLNWQKWSKRLSGRASESQVYNLNDPRWGQDDRPSDQNDRPQSDDRPSGQRPGQQGPNQGPPDLDELWRDFNRKLGGILGGGGQGGGRQSGVASGGSGGSGASRFGIGMIVVLAVLIWAGTGIFIVQEGEQAVVTRFGKYSKTVDAGFQWRLPYPFEQHETVSTTQLRSVDVGGDRVIPATGLRESSMLTADENIVDIRFVVQYRLNDARAYLFETSDPTTAVVKAAETSVREVVGKMKMDEALVEERDQIAPRVRGLMQTILDRYKVGIEVVGVNLQLVRPPVQVQEAFDDVLKASQERDRQKNEAQAYANNVVPRARGTASRMVEDAEGYRARIVAQAEGDARRFAEIQAEYAKAPQVTRERLYIDAMKDVYRNTTKVMVDTRSGSNVMYLPLDKITEMSSRGTARTGSTANSAGSTSSASSTGSSSSSSQTGNNALRDDLRSRDRGSR
jgi:membrane protease subunit HflK